MKTERKRKIINTLEILEKENITPGELNELAKFCCNISYMFVIKNRNKITPCFLGGEYNYKDFAISAVTPLFLRNQQNEYSIRTAFKNWGSPISTQSEAIAFLHKLIKSRVEQHLSESIRNSDPYYIKLQRTIYHFARKQNFRIIKHSGKTYFAKPDVTFACRKFIDEEAFESIPYYLLSNDETILREIAAFLESETDFVPAIPVNILIRRLRYLRGDEEYDCEVNPGDNSEAITESRINYMDDSIHVNDMISYAISKSAAKLDKFYLGKNKLNSHEAGSLKAAIADMAWDIKHGFSCHGLHSYLDTHMESLSREDYEQKYQNILEYLLKTIKTTIAQSMVN
ncbi:MAG: hypothetical protein ACM3UR_10420 [Bacteroidota bacterium]|jgi:hypothetical protein|nr:hypothetical protein [Ignavibacteria bacterium]MCU7499683.1 hypothetical protein [Ignavibacteria bacterium]MCU7511989.1 hypothetical protein [Ignavibacteria bacterium]MCU7521311.1 hypothetical protein [Ignavibacteria bacterium]MCU7524760.1 hypothetical protein [Ignavibacteria bacterium]